MSNSTRNSEKTGTSIKFTEGIPVNSSVREQALQKKAKKNKKIKILLICCLVIILLAAVIYLLTSGVLSGSETIQYDENGGSDEIVPDTSNVDPASLPYYGFAEAKCRQSGDKVWETLGALSENAGAFQVDEADISAPYILFKAEPQAYTEDDFNTTVRILKNRLDLLEVPYALGYEKNKSENSPPYCIWIKTGTERMGAPVFLMLAHRKSSTYNGEPTLSSQTGDYVLYNVEDFTYRKRLTGTYDMFVSGKGTNLDGDFYYNADEEYSKFMEFLRTHKDENIYWVYDGTAFASIPITNDLIPYFKKNNKIRFSEFCFQDNSALTEEDQFLLKLLYVSLKGEQYPVDVDIDDYESISFSEGANESNLGYHINTHIDESLRETVKEIHPNSLCFRPAMATKGSEIRIHLIYNESEYEDTKFAETVKKIYESNSAIADACYQNVHFVAVVNTTDKNGNPKQSYKQIINFYKEPEGQISMNYTLSSDASASFKQMMKTDPLFQQLQQNSSGNAVNPSEIKRSDMFDDAVTEEDIDSN